MKSWVCWRTAKFRRTVKDGERGENVNQATYDSNKLIQTLRNDHKNIPIADWLNFQASWVKIWIFKVIRTSLAPIEIFKASWTSWAKVEIFKASWTSWAKIGISKVGRTSLTPIYIFKASGTSRASTNKKIANDGLSQPQNVSEINFNSESWIKRYQDSIWWFIPSLFMLYFRPS